MNRYLLLLPLVTVFGAPAGADLQSGYDAYLRGDYATTHRELTPLAEQGNALAQFGLGKMYGNGKGVAQNDAEAVKWYRKAAEQGHVDAQYNLGVMYDNGRGVPQDYVQAHMWLNLAAAQGIKVAGKMRDVVAEDMTSAQVAEAQRLAREWLEKHSSGN